MSLDAFQQVAPATEINTKEGPPVVQQQFLFRTRNAADNEQIFYAIQSELAPYHVQTIASGYIAPQSVASAQMTLNGLSIVFISLASMALLLTCLLILTTMNTMLTEQLKIIGTMKKAIGATRGKIMRGYLLTVGIYALIGTALGLAPGLLLCTQVANVVAQQTKLDLGPYQPAPGVILVSLVAGLVIPELGALLPLWMGTRITVHQAMASYGINIGSARRVRRGR
jgi:ABC-type antimicrobial peptide transport system permease subunit